MVAECKVAERQYLGRQKGQTTFVEWFGLIWDGGAMILGFRGVSENVDIQQLQGCVDYRRAEQKKGVDKHFVAAAPALELGSRAQQTFVSPLIIII